MISIARQLYRNRALGVIFLSLLLLPAGWGQKKKTEGPRATALAVMSPDGKTASRLIPLCIRDNGQFWDASIYQASPRPMALDPGVVYEIERTGSPVGLFTISNPVQENGSWIALGSSQPPQAHLARIPANVDDERPVLRRSPSASSDSVSATAPRQLPAPASVTSDPDRPILQRGKPAEVSQPAIPATPAGQPAAQKPAPPKPPELLPAISDAGGPDPRPFVFEGNADQQAGLRKTATTLVEAAVLKQAGLTPASARLDYKENLVRFFDLDGNNSAELVLTAHLAVLPQTPVQRVRRGAPARSPSPPASVSAREFYVTFIAREDLEGQVHPALLRITDARNLDLDGRLELIDAADVDGDGRGELLFRRLVGKDTTYVIYKVGLSQTTKLFDSAGES